MIIMENRIKSIECISASEKGCENYHLMKYLVINIDEKLSAIFTVGILTVAKSMQQQTFSPDRMGLCLTKECR